MKNFLSRVISIALVSLFFVFGSSQKIQAQDVTVSYQDFYDNLSPYGQWVEDPQYGNVWVPNEGGDFRPYGNRGHWVMTDYGNTWVSDDPWGWACYHYGRWTYNSYYGWVWIPGYEWAPAWVSWRYGGGYSGWAPLGPGMAIGYSNLPESWWIFVEPRYMYDHDYYHHWRGPSYNNTYIRQTTVVNNYFVDNSTHVRYNYGPKADVIQRDTRQPVQVYHVSQTSRPGAPGISGNNVSLYRPAVNRGTQSTARPANVMQAPRQVGKPQPATNVSAGRQPEFRQQVQKQAAQPQNRPQQQQQQQNRPQPQQQPQNRPQPQPQQQPQNRPQPQPQQQPQNRPQPQQQPQNRPQPQPQQQPQNRPQPQPQQQPQNRPQPQQQPQNRPQPQQQPQSRPQPQPQNRPQPQQAPRQAPAQREEGGRR